MGARLHPAPRMFGRSHELAVATRRIATGGSLLLYGPRGYGKTLLLQNAIHQYQAQYRDTEPLVPPAILAVDIDLSVSWASAAETLAEQAAFAFAGANGAGAVQQAFESLYPSASQDPVTGRWSISFKLPADTARGLSRGRAADVILSSLRGAAWMATRGTRPGVIVLDGAGEWQRAMGVEGLRQLLGEAGWTDQAAGSPYRKPRLSLAVAVDTAMDEELSEDADLLSEWDDTLYLGPASDMEFAEGIAGIWRAYDAQADTGTLLGLADELLEMLGDRPGPTLHAAEYIGAVASRLPSRRISRGLISKALAQMVDAEAAGYARIWRSLPEGQRATLTAVTSTGGRQIFGQAGRRATGLGQSSIQKALGRLIEIDLIAQEGTGSGVRFRFTDPLFESWVRRIAPRRGASAR